jgi:hypothetical protein
MEKSPMTVKADVLLTDASCTGIVPQCGDGSTANWYIARGGTMFASERFLSRLAKLRKEYRESPTDELVELVRSAFTSMLTGLPDSMPDDIYESVSERIIARGDQSESYLDQATYLSDVADLFALQYDEKTDPLHRDDWELIGQIVNDYALDLDMETVNYVMRLVVDHHGISRGGS